MWYREGCLKWLGLILYDYLDYFQGEVLGDYGFDILGLFCDFIVFERYFKYVMYFYINYFVLCFFSFIWDVLVILKEFIYVV